VLKLLVTANVVPSMLILFTHEDGGGTFLRNVGSYKSNRASHPEDGILRDVNMAISELSKHMNENYSSACSSVQM
jgi:hypothetical protein